LNGVPAPTLEYRSPNTKPAPRVAPPRVALMAVISCATGCLGLTLLSPHGGNVLDVNLGNPGSMRPFRVLFYLAEIGAFVMFGGTWLAVVQLKRSLRTARDVREVETIWTRSCSTSPKTSKPSG
jgi:hypothetical protein